MKKKLENFQVGGKKFDLITQEPLLVNPLFFKVPQNRKRIFILAVRKDVPQKARNAIKEFLNRDLKPHPETNINSILSSSAPSKYNIASDKQPVLDLWEDFLKILQAKNIKVPTFPIWASEFGQTKRISSPKYSNYAKEIAKKNRDFYKKNTSALRGWLSKTKKCPHFKGTKTQLEFNGNRKAQKLSIWNNLIQFRQSGVRIISPKYFPTLVAMVQIPIVGKKKRQLTPRECARLQSFPESFKLHSTDQKCYKQMGNAVNVKAVTYMMYPVAKNVF